MLRCLIIDDEPLAQELIENYILRVRDLQLVKKCDDALQAFEILRKEKIDLIFLDIQMPVIDGLGFLKSMKITPAVIITTAFPQHALESYDFDVVDYLLKPISFERFLKAVNKVMDVPLQKTDDKEIFADKKKEITDTFIHFRADRKILKIALNDILYIESLKDYIKVVTKTKTIITKQSISSLEENLPGNSFIRIHRSYIVALDKIESYTSELVEIAKQELPISRMYRHEVEKSLKS